MSTFVARARDWQRVLKPFDRIIQRGGWVGVLFCVEIRPHPHAAGSAIVAATDLDNVLERTIDGLSIAEGEGLVAPLRPLLGFVESVSANATVTLEVDGEAREAGGDRLVVSTETASLTLDLPDTGPALSRAGMVPGSDTSVAPLMRAESGPDLGDVFERVARFASSDECRYYLHGAALQHVNGWRLIATDGRRLIDHPIMARLRRTETAGEPDTFPGVIIRTTTLRLAAWLARQCGPFRITVRPTRIRFTFGDGTVLESRLIDGCFPDWPRVVPQDPGFAFEVNGGHLRAALTTIRKAAPAATAVDVRPVEGALVLTAKAADGARAAATVGGATDIAPGFDGVHVNPLYLAHILDTFPAGPLRFAQGREHPSGDDRRLPPPLLVTTPPTGVPYRIVQMPIRIVKSEAANEGA